MDGSTSGAVSGKSGQGLRKQLSKSAGSTRTETVDSQDLPQQCLNGLRTERPSGQAPMSIQDHVSRVVNRYLARRQADTEANGSRPAYEHEARAKAAGQGVQRLPSTPVYTPASTPPRKEAVSESGEVRDSLDVQKHSVSQQYRPGITSKPAAPAVTGPIGTDVDGSMRQGPEKQLSGDAGSRRTKTAVGQTLARETGRQQGRSAKGSTLESVKGSELRRPQRQLSENAGSIRIETAVGQSRCGIAQMRGDQT